MTSNEDTEEKKDKTFKDVLLRFAENTSISGLPHLRNSKRRVGQAFWTVLLLAGFGLMFFHLYHLFQEFLSWPKKTTLTLGFSNLVLPAVTICNVNTIRKSRLGMASTKLQNFVNKIDPTLLKRKKRFTNAFDNLDIGAYEDDYGLDPDFSGDADYNPSADYVDEYAQDLGFAEKEKLAEINEKYRFLFLNESRDNRVNMGHQFNKSLISCSFNGYKCYAENFTVYQTPKYGNCYTLNSKKLIIKRPGPSAGLSLILYLETDEYLAGITDGYGIRVHLHATDSVPFPEDSGFFLPAAVESNLALEQTTIDRIGQPYGECATDDEFNKLYSKTYNRQSCLYLCQTTLTIQHCGCYDPGNAEIMRSTPKKACTTQKEIRCMIHVGRQLAQKNMTCSCPDPCLEKAYSVTLTSRQWPTNAYATLLRKDVCEEYPDDCDVLTPLDGESLRLNFLKFIIYYKELNFQTITEEPDIGNAQFASDFGGAIGLWIGLSILSMFEVVHLVGMIVGHFMNKSKKSPKRIPRKRHYPYAPSVDSTGKGCYAEEPYINSDNIIIDRNNPYGVPPGTRMLNVSRVPSESGKDRFPPNSPSNGYGNKRIYTGQSW